MQSQHRRVALNVAVVKNRLEEVEVAIKRELEINGKSIFPTESTFDSIVVPELLLDFLRDQCAKVSPCALGTWITTVPRAQGVAQVNQKNVNVVMPDPKPEEYGTKSGLRRFFDSEGFLQATGNLEFDGKAVSTGSLIRHQVLGDLLVMGICVYKNWKWTMKVEGFIVGLSLTPLSSELPTILNLAQVMECK